VYSLFKSESNDQVEFSKEQIEEIEFGLKQLDDGQGISFKEYLKKVS
jgi:hypothetical protein